MRRLSRLWLATTLLLLANIPAGYAVGFVPAPPLATPRTAHTATLLPSGNVLVAGGSANATGTLASAEIYDSSSNTWAAAAPLPATRGYHTATLLPSGKVLVVGGYRTNSGPLASAELYDPASNAWQSAGTMQNTRWQHTATLLVSGKVLVVGGYGASGTAQASAELYDPVNNAWSSAALPATARASHSATLLASGKVLVAGGANATTLSSAELYDPVSNTWAPAGSLGVARNSATSTLLSTGMVLIVGGSGGGGNLASAELYDPTSNTWSPASSPANARGNHTSTLLPSGLVLVAGGASNSGFLNNAEIYDAASNAWSSAGSLLPTAVASHTATFLATGRILIAAGSANASETSSAALYDPAVGAWGSTGSLISARYGHTATLLPSGKILVASGRDNITGYLDTCELYDPASGTWSPAKSVHVAREHPSGVLLATGKVMLIGGAGNSGSLASTELYDPSNDSWVQTATLNKPREEPDAVLLPSGKILVTGNEGPPAFDNPEIYDPATDSWSMTGALVTPRWFAKTTLLASGKVLLAGGSNTSGFVANGELYDPATNSWSATGAMLVPRGFHTATLLASGKVLVAGGSGVGSGYATTAELYDPSTGTWKPAGSLAIGRNAPTARVLPSGKVLLVGGITGLGPSGTYVASAEIYDPVSNAWASAGALATAREEHSETLLPSGKLLITGGENGVALGVGQIGTSEIYDPGLTPDMTRLPTLSTTDAFLLPTSRISATGTGFHPDLTGDNAHNGSSANFAVFQLERIDNGQMRFVANDENVARSDTAFTGSPSALAGFPAGPILLRSWVNGIPGATLMTRLALTPGASVAPVASGGALAASLSFSPATYDGGAPITSYTATASPGGATASCNAPCTSIAFNPIAPGAYTFSIVANNAAGAGPASPASNAITVSRVGSSTGLVSDNDPSFFAQNVTFTATVAGFSPTGTVTFIDGATEICSNVALVGNSASCAAATLSAGGHSVTASYSGDGQNFGSTSDTLVQTVNPVTSSTSLAASPNPSRYGQSVTFTASVSGVSPSGTVEFSDGARSLCAGIAVNAGTATCTTSALPVGLHSVTATYGGDVQNSGSTSNTVSQRVDVANSVTMLSSVPNPSTYAQSVTFTATVSGVEATGTVAFFDGATLVCSGATLVGTTVDCATSALATGAHSITATYSGDTNNTGSTSAALSQQVEAASSATTLSSDANPAAFAQTVTLTATVAAQSPSGTVAFNEGATPLCSAVALSGTSATCAISSLSVGSHSITAAYSGDANNLGSTSVSLTQQIDKAASNVVLTSSPNPGTYAQPVTFTATVTGQAPAGTMTFNEGASALCMDVPLDAGVATCASAALSAGSHSIQASYSGDVNNAAATSSLLSQSIARAATTMTLSTPCQTTFVENQPFTLDARVSGAEPSGAASFATSDDIMLCANVPLVTATASCTSSALATDSGHVVVPLRLIAHYGGDSNYEPSDSLPLPIIVLSAADVVFRGAFEADDLSCPIE